MKFENLKKAQLVDILNKIQGEIAFIEKIASDNRKDVEEKRIACAEWMEGRASAFDQAAEWLNKTIQESTRP